MKIAFGSKNPAKINAVKSAAESLFKNVPIEIASFAVSSGVAAQPLHDLETQTGAINRAKGALLMGGDEFDFGIGIEGGLSELGGKWFLSTWVAVIDHDGKIGIGSSSRFEISAKIMQKLQLKPGSELGPIMDELSGLKDTRLNAGAIGLLTNHNMDRAEFNRHAVICAFAPFVSDQSLWV